MTAMLHSYAVLRTLPTIGIDCRFASAHAGLGRYTRSVVRSLLKRSDPWSYVLFVRSAEEVWLHGIGQRDRVKLVIAPVGHYSFAEQIKLPKLVKEAGCDLFYAPHFNVPLFLRTPFICTVQDLILHRYPNNVGLLKQCAYRVTFWRAVQRANAIIVISESTQLDLCRLYPKSCDRSFVLYPGVDPVFQRADAGQISALRQKYGLSGPFLLYVGNCKQHKNIPMLIDAFKRVQLQGIELVLVTSGKECKSIVFPAGVRRISDITDADFPALYSAALGLVTASLAEGFGLPIVEAMACGCPVLATVCGSFPEVCGEYALLVKPTTEALADGMRRLLTDPALRSAERLDGARTWVKQYDWDSSAVYLASLLEKELAPYRSCATGMG